MATVRKQQAMNNAGASGSKLRDLRRPRKLRLMCNGNSHYKGKRVSIVPQKYRTFDDVLTDFTNQLVNGVQLPYGVRNIYTPVGGTHVKNIGQLLDGQSYVCAGFEKFKAIKYFYDDSLAKNGW